MGTLRANQAVLGHEYLLVPVAGRAVNASFVNAKIKIVSLDSYRYSYDIVYQKTNGETGKTFLAKDDTHWNLVRLS